MFLYRDKGLSKKAKEANNRFLSFINKLFKLKIVKDYNRKTKIITLEEKISINNFPDKAWVLEKLQELKN